MHAKHLALAAATASAAVALWFATVSNDELPPAAVANHTESTPGEQPPVDRAACDRHAMEPGAELRRGTRLSYRFEMTSSLALGEQVVRQRVAGDMRVQVIDRREGEILAEVCFPGVEARAEVGAESVEVEMAHALAVPTALLLSERGETLGYRFAPELLSDHRNWVRTLVSAFRFVAPPPGARAWDTVEAESLGRVAVAYMREGTTTRGMRVERRKTGYPDLKRAEPRGRAVAELREGLLWPVAAQIDEEATVGLGAGMHAEHGLVGHLELVSIDEVAAGAADWSGPWAPASGAHERSELGDAEEEKRWRLRASHAHLADVLAFLSERTKERPLSLEARDQLELLAAMIEHRPEIVAELARMLLDPQDAHDAAEFGLQALAAAGTAEAQELLVACVEHGGLKHGTRMAALDAMFTLQTPDAGLAARLGHMVTDAVAITEVEGTAMLLVGSLVGRDAAGVDVLLAAEGRVRSEGLTPLWLQALGNAGTDEVLTAAMPYAHDADPHTRAAAMTALRQVRASDAVRVLADRARHDDSAVVRCSAVRALAETPGAVDFGTLSDLASQDPDESVRHAALLGLRHRAAGDPRLRPFLERRASEDPADGVRALLRELLAE